GENWAAVRAGDRGVSWKRGEARYWTATLPARNRHTTVAVRLSRRMGPWKAVSWPSPRSPSEPRTATTTAVATGRARSSRRNEGMATLQGTDHQGEQQRRQAEDHRQRVELHQPVLHRPQQPAEQPRHVPEEVDQRVDEAQVRPLGEQADPLEALDDHRVVNLVDVELVQRQLVQPRDRLRHAGGQLRLAAAH